MKRESATKLLILKTTRLLAKEGGWDNVSVRKIADSIQYKAPVIYEFFENREDLIAQVIEDGLSDLRKQIKSTWRELDKKDRSLIPISLAYWKYAHKNSEVYSAMNLFSTFKQTHVGIKNQTQEFCTDVSEMISEWAAEHGIKNIDAVELTEILWAHLHGLVSLGLSGELGSPKQVLERIQSSVLIFEKGLKAK
jgi:AcrR family transcriptional regulator